MRAQTTPCLSIISSRLNSFARYCYHWLWFISPLTVWFILTEYSVAYLYLSIVTQCNVWLGITSCTRHLSISWSPILSLSNNVSANQVTGCDRQLLCELSTFLSVMCHVCVYVCMCVSVVNNVQRQHVKLTSQVCAPTSRYTLLNKQCSAISSSSSSSSCANIGQTCRCTCTRFYRSYFTVRVFSTNTTHKQQRKRQINKSLWANTIESIGCCYL